MEVFWCRNCKLPVIFAFTEAISESLMWIKSTMKLKSQTSWQGTMKIKLKSSEQHSCLIIKADNFTQNKAESKHFGWNGHDRIMETHLNYKGKAEAAMKNGISGKASLLSTTCSSTKRGLYRDKEISSIMMQTTGPG